MPPDDDRKLLQRSVNKGTAGGVSASGRQPLPCHAIAHARDGCSPEVEPRLTNRGTYSSLARERGWRLVGNSPHSGA